MKIKIIIFLLLILCFSIITGKTLYEQAMNYYENNDYYNAKKLLIKIINNENSTHEELINAYCLLFKIEPYKDNKKENIANQIISMFPEDSKTNLIRLEMANYFINKEEYFEASKYLAGYVLFADKNSKGYDSVLKRLQKYIRNKLEPTEIEYLLYNYRFEPLIPFMLFRLYTIYYENKEYEHAEFFRQKLIMDYPNSFYTKHYILELENTNIRGNKVAILLPNTGELAPYAESVRKGIVIALNEENIKYTLFNTQSNPVKAVKIIDSIMRANEYISVIGPISNIETIAVASYLYKNDYLPVISPIASDAELLNFSDNVFLLNLTLVEQADFTANFVNNNDSIKTIGIIYPDNSYGRTLSQIFAEKIDSNKIKILFNLSYMPGITDFSNQLSMIKEMNIDAIYLPVSVEDAILLATQILYYDIKVRIIGSDTWYNEDLIRLAKDYIQNTIVIKPLEINKYDDDYINFKLNYMKRYNIEPDKFAQLGYDAFKLIAKLFKDGYNNRKSIIKYLKNMEYYKGVSGKLSFSASRENFNIYIIKGNQFIKKE